QLAGSFVKVELTYLNDEKRVVLVEMPHYEFSNKKIQKGDILGIRTRKLRSFENGAGI
ncbi:MAG TPA: sulfate ABC transporter ATP-binding protein, partial [Arcobacter skirrowii]|nr:sulfate ABC transporter ATP-binding protein [Aliarcobacter skirrowii]